jgi:hypothetical protein
MAKQPYTTRDIHCPPSGRETSPFNPTLAEKVNTEPKLGEYRKKGNSNLSNYAFLCCWRRQTYLRVVPNGKHYKGNVQTLLAQARVHCPHYLSASTATGCGTNTTE